MTRIVTLGVLAAFFVTLGGPGFSITPVSAAEMMEADKAMMKATGEDLSALKKELAAIQAELQKLNSRVGGMTKMVDKTVSDYCKSVPESLKKAGFAPGLCS
jgi:peptidoglycan hydrolase CwlO-like protein